MESATGVGSSRREGPEGGGLMRGPVCVKEINSVAGLKCSTGRLSLP